MVFRWVFITALSAVLLAGCGGGKSKQQKLQEKQQKEYVKALPKTDTVDKLWSRNVGDFKQTGFQIKVDNGFIYSIDAEGKLLALDATNGKVLWKQKTGLNINAGIGVGQQSLFAVDSKGRLHAFARNSGQEVWAAELSSSVVVPPVYSHGKVVVKTQDARLIAFEAATGLVQWTYRHQKPDLSLYGGSTPIVGENFVLCGFADGRLIAIEASSGSLIWDIPVARKSGRNEVQRLSDIDSQPIFADRTLYISAYQHQTMALDTETGSVSWLAPYSSYFDMAVSENALFMIDINRNIIALDRQQGQILWANENMKGIDFTSISIINNRLLLTASDDKVFVLNPADGSVLGREKLSGGALLTQPVIVDNVAYILNDDGDLKALTVNL